MKLGDLICVKYKDDEPNVYHGIIFQPPEDGPLTMWKIWCIERGRVHVFVPHLDKIEVVSAA